MHNDRMNDRAVICERCGDVALLVLSDLQPGNLLSHDLARQLDDVVNGVARDQLLKGVVLTARGDNFCVGGDVKAFTAAQSLSDVARAQLPLLNSVIRTLQALPCPTIAFVQGACAGGGLGLALACDVVVCAEDAVLAAGFARIGLAPDTGVSALVTRRLGEGGAIKFLLLDQRLSARDGLRIGLVDEVVPLRQLDMRAEKFIAILNGLPRDAMKETRKLVLMTASTTLSDHLDAELDTALRLADADDAKEGLMAFRERRNPQF